MTGKEMALLWIERLCRIGMGALFIYSAAMKVDDPGLFADAVSRYEFLPEFSIGMFSLTMSMLELIVGVALVATKWTREAALLVTVMLLMFIVALAQAFVRGLDISCGCFGAPKIGGRAEIAVALVRDVVLLVPAVWLMTRRNGWLFARAARPAVALLVGVTVGVCAHAEMAVTDGPVRPGEWNSDFKAVMKEAERSHLPMVFVHTTPECTFCARLRKSLDGGAFQLWSAERAPLMAYIDDLSPQSPSSSGRAALAFVKGVVPGHLDFPHVGVYWPREGGVTNRVAFSGRRGLMGVGRQGPQLVSEVVAALDSALGDYLAGKQCRKANELLKAGVKTISCRVEGGGGSVAMKPRSGIFKEGEAVKLSAAADEGFVFVEWRGPDGTVAGRSPKLTVQGGMPAGCYLAHFRKASACSPPVLVAPRGEQIAHVGERFRYSVSLSAESYPVEFRVLGGMPPGLKLRGTASGVISGYPTEAGTNDVEIAVVGSDAAKTEVRFPLRLVILPAAAATSK